MRLVREIRRLDISNTIQWLNATEILADILMQNGRIRMAFDLLRNVITSEAFQKCLVRDRERIHFRYLFAGELLKDTRNDNLISLRKKVRMTSFHRTLLETARYARDSDEDNLERCYERLVNLVNHTEDLRSDDTTNTFLRALRLAIDRRQGLAIHGKRQQQNTAKSDHRARTAFSPIPYDLILKEVHQRAR